MKQNKEINFEINLLPVISMLAVCISFLLLTTVWIKIGTLDVKQALGEASEVTQKEVPSLWVIMGESGDVVFQLKNITTSKQKEVRFAGKKSDAQWKQIQTFAESLKQDVPDLQMALVFPDRQTSFDDVIKTIDLLKKTEISDVGVAPL